MLGQVEWEYRVVRQIFEEFDAEEIENLLNELGAQKWELVSVSPSLYTYYFKRPKTN